MKEKLEQRAKLVAEARAIRDKADSEKRELTGEEAAAVDQIFAVVDELKAAIDAEGTPPEPTPEEIQEANARRAERFAREERELSAARGRRTSPDNPSNQPSSELRQALAGVSQRVRERFNGLADNPALAARATSDYARQFRSALLGNREHRNLQMGVNALGGYLAPIQFVADLIQAVDNEVAIRQRATVYTVSGGSRLGIPTIDADIADYEWVSELTTAAVDTTARVGMREWTPHPMSKLVKASRTLLRNAVVGVEALVRERLAYKLAITEERHFLTGSGVGQPLGLFTAHAAGIPATRDVSTGNTQTSITFDGLINALYSLKAPYQANAVWLFHRDALRQIRTLKDGEGQYLWRPATIEGQPDTILGRPFIMSEYVPNTFTNGLYVGLVGDLSKYYIADSLDLEVQMLDQPYATTNEIGWLARAECDGMPVLGEAFARVTLAA